jgi:uncharacterized protein (TIGR03792 family)
VEPFRYASGERRPVEVLIFDVDPEHRQEWLAADHEIWTLGEWSMPGPGGGRLLSKEVWLDDGRPGEVWVVIEWPDVESWELVDQEWFQQQLVEAFAARFPYRSQLVGALHEERGRGMYRWSRFEPVRPRR